MVWKEGKKNTGKEVKRVRDKRHIEVSEWKQTCLEDTRK